MKEFKQDNTTVSIRRITWGESKRLKKDNVIGGGTGNEEWDLDEAISTVLGNQLNETELKSLEDFEFPKVFDMFQYALGNKTSADIEAGEDTEAKN